MITETIPMWTSQRTPVPLHYVLGLFQPNSLRWRVEDFEGIGRFPSGMTYAEFGDMVAAGAAAFDWNGIQQFAGGIDQMIDGMIVATDENGTTVLTIDVLDSTEYEIVIDPVWNGAAAFVSAVRSSRRGVEKRRSGVNSALSGTSGSSELPVSRLPPST
ncbi:hypothetical protein IU438_03930 [Nocardia cyriacigeorgica]|uniref:hypothetical protein n=1 Tax=Nocardia cyriacigeorgica TaxID=135487 RepID=UPI001893A783|nr:hypothetical protein [Nocardia cyriacigeorgica]MBF6394933.1 hypothetical protein [Nocardia cyriacigeorgica]MBF6400566.1 hypothetical protein [Nocardia cyriacigeorgica]